MKQNMTEVTPTVCVAINKSRIKQHNKQSETPTYYLKDGTEFQLELFNPTTDVVLAKIEINNKLISQSGLIINPGQRVFLDRYIDVAKKFKFETYEVNDTKEVKAAIANNGDLKVMFYREQASNPVLFFNPTVKTFYNQDVNNVLRGTGGMYGGTVTNTGLGGQSSLTNIGNMNLTSTSNAEVTFDSLSDSSTEFSSEIKPTHDHKKRSRKSKSIESGRVEMGGESEQTFQTVDKTFEYSPFCTIEYKILPVSQKPQTVKDVVTNNYCTQCGAKVKGTFKFCPSCGERV